MADKPETGPNSSSTSAGYWKDENTYVGYYQCIPGSKDYPCPEASPGWKKISEKDVGVGTFGGCPYCEMTEIYWERINIAPGTPPVVAPISYSYEIIMKDGSIGIEGNPGVAGNYGNKIAVTRDPLTGLLIRVDQAGNAIPPVGCTEGTTRTVTCPNNGKLITQICTGNAWVTVKADETKCLSDGGISLSNTNTIIAILIIVIVIFYLIERK